MKLPILVVNSFNCGICLLDNHTGESKRDFVAERWTYWGAQHRNLFASMLFTNRKIGLARSGQPGGSRALYAGPRDLIFCQLARTAVRMNPTKVRACAAGAADTAYMPLFVLSQPRSLTSANNISH